MGTSIQIVLLGEEGQANSTSRGTSLRIPLGLEVKRCRNTVENSQLQGLLVPLPVPLVLLAFTVLVRKVLKVARRLQHRVPIRNRTPHQANTRTMQDTRPLRKVMQVTEGPVRLAQRVLSAAHIPAHSLLVHFHHPTITDILVRGHHWQ